MSLAILEKWLFFLCLLFLPTQLGKHFFLDFSFIYSLPVDYLAPTIYFWDLLVFTLVALWLVQKPYINKLALNILLVFLLSQSLSLISAKNPGAGFFRLEQLAVGSLFGLYIASINLNNLKKGLSLPLAVSLVFEAFLSILQFYKGGSAGFWLLGERSFTISTPSIAKFDWFGQVMLRPYATFPHPNVMACFMVIVSFLLFSLNLKGRWFILLLASFAVMLSFSRSVILVLSLELIYFARRHIKYLVLVLLLASPLLYVRFSSLFNYDVISLIRREELAEIALRIFQTSPIFGVGLNNFINFVSSANIVSGSSRFLQPVHNIFLLSLAETGIVGFVGFVAFLGSGFLILAKKGKEDLTKVLLFCLGAIVFLGMIDHYFLTLPQGQRLMFLIWGLSLSFSRKYN